MPRPTEKQLRNLILTPEQRRANIEKMVKTRRRQTEEDYSALARRYEPLRADGISVKDAAPVLGVSRALLGRAVRWVKAQTVESRVAEVIKS